MSLCQDPNGRVIINTIDKWYAQFARKQPCSPSMNPSTMESMPLPSLLSATDCHDDAHVEQAGALYAVPLFFMLQ